MYEFDAVLLDYSMPDMNGCDVAFEIERCVRNKTCKTGTCSDIAFW